MEERYKGRAASFAGVLVRWYDFFVYGAAAGPICLSAILGYVLGPSSMFGDRSVFFSGLFGREGSGFPGPGSGRRRRCLNR